MNKASIAISLDDVKVTLDKNNVEATHLLHFSFMSNMSSCGGVRVHLHHSTRTIQMQGSHVMPDKTSAPVWFLNAIVLNKFKDLAKVKQFVIKNTNEAIKKSTKAYQKKCVPPTSSNNNCQGCSAIFDTKSKPSMCNNC